MDPDFIDNPIVLSDLAWHGINEKWLPVETFARQWIPPMASGMQIGLLKGLEKLSSQRNDYLNLTTEQARHLITTLKVARP